MKHHEPDKDDLDPIGDLGDHPKIIAADIENHAIAVEIGRIESNPNFDSMSFVQILIPTVSR